MCESQSIIQLALLFGMGIFSSTVPILYHVFLFFVCFCFSLPRGIETTCSKCVNCFSTLKSMQLSLIFWQHFWVKLYPGCSSRRVKLDLVCHVITLHMSLLVHWTYHRHPDFWKNMSNFARYNWPHSFSCTARWLKRQISCHNKRYIQLSQSRPCTGEVQTRHEYWNLYITMMWSYHVVESSWCKHGRKWCSLLRQKHQNFSKISMDRLIKRDK